jgi:LCP family protein required for cell wall assembly
MESKVEGTKNPAKINFKLFLLVSTGVLILSGLIATIYIHTQLKKVIPVDINRSPNSLGISPLVLGHIDSLEDPPFNIALFGLDKRPGERFGNSDVIMILSISKATKKIKLSSIMRDTYVDIDSIGKGKINAAYKAGGPQLALKAINKNFNLAIPDFVSVDFNGMANVIEALDGVSLDVKKEEVNWINAYLDENNRNRKLKPPYVTKPGLQLLNGKQAVAYTRIRYVGNDWERTARQRTVLSLILHKLKNAGPTEYPAIVSKVLPYVETSLPQISLLSLGADVFLSGINTVEERRFPAHNESKGTFIDGTWYLLTDLPATSKSLSNYIYEGSKLK